MLPKRISGTVLPNNNYFFELMINKIAAHHVRLTLLLVWLIILFFANSEPLRLIIEYGGFALLGVVGAIFANATGAGGGVVFVPFFNQLEFSASTTVATSFAIQCCGMTAGAVTWWSFYKKEKHAFGQWHELGRILSLTVPFSLAGLMLVQYNSDWFSHFADPENLHSGFGFFSIFLALAIFASIPLLKRERFHRDLSQYDLFVLPFIAFVGGAITAWLSVGVGELIAVYLIMRRFNVAFSIAVAVILSAFSVWGAIIFHLLVSQDIYWPVVLFAGAGAIVGGILAKRVVLYFSATNLKIFFASWILLLGVSVLPF